MKKKIPLGLRKILDEVNSQIDNLFSVEFADDYVVKFNDKDISSDFFFEVTKINPPANNVTSYAIRYKPYNEETLDVRAVNVTLANFKGHFLTWKKLLIESNFESPLFDDMITQSYYDELEPQFEIIDDDASFKTFTIIQQTKIVKFLDVANQIIEDQKNDAVEKIIIIKLIEETKNSISKTTKKEVLGKLRKIISLGFKMGLQVGEKLLIEFTTELTKKLIMNN